MGLASGKGSLSRAANSAPWILPIDTGKSQMRPMKSLRGVMTIMMILLRQNASIAGRYRLGRNCQAWTAHHHCTTARWRGIVSEALNGARGGRNWSVIGG
jgi:hypothetical protein